MGSDPDNIKAKPLTYSCLSIETAANGYIVSEAHPLYKFQDPAVARSVGPVRVFNDFDELASFLRESLDEVEALPSVLKVGV